jgi:hypothetical protein
MSLSILLHGRNFGGRQAWVITFLLPTTFLLAYLVGRRFAVKRDFKWAGPAMLLGVWLTGGLFMMVAATVSGGGFASRDGLRSSLSLIFFSMFPPVTYVMATYDGSLLALIAVTVGALLIWGIRRQKNRPHPSQCEMAVEVIEQRQGNSGA